MNLSTILLFTGNVLFNAAANLLMKVGMERAGAFDLATVHGLVKGVLLNPVLIGGVFSYIASLGFYMFAIRNVKLSVAYPLSVSCAVVLVTVLSGVLLKETISASQIVGGTIILVGIFVLMR